MSFFLNKKIVLSKESETIFGNITNLINNIWSKTASMELDDTLKREPHLFNDPNFQVFVKETNKGKQLNEHLTELADWMDRLCDAMEKLDTRTETYLARQERFNG